MYEYERIAQDLAKQIQDGVWAPGKALPKVDELMKRYGVSRITVRGGLEQLKNRNMVYTGFADGRRGTIVRGRDEIEFTTTDALRSLMDDRAPTASVDAFTSNAIKLDKVPSKAFTMRIEPAPTRIAECLGIHQGEFVVVRTLKQLLDGEPISLEISYYPRDLAAEVGLDVSHDIPKGTIRALRDAGHIEVAHRDVLRKADATEQQAYELGVSPGATLLWRTRTAATAQRITRCTEYLQIAGRTRLVWEVGDQAGIDIILSTLREDTAK